MTIRPAAETDLDDIVRMYERLYETLVTQGMKYELDSAKTREVLVSQIKSKLYCVLVAEGVDGNIGFISASVSRIDRKLKGGLVGVVHDIFVVPESRGGGVAAALLTEAEQWMRQSGAVSAGCDVISGNTGGRGFWSSRGYSEMNISMYKEL